MSKIKDLPLVLLDENINKVLIITLDDIFNIIQFISDLPDSEYKILNLNQATVYIPDKIRGDVKINGLYFERFFNQYDKGSLELNRYIMFRKRSKEIIQKNYPIFMGRRLLAISLEYAELVFFFEELESPFYHVSIQSDHKEQYQFLFFDCKMKLVRQAPLTISREDFEVLVEKEWCRLRVKSHRRRKNR